MSTARRKEGLIFDLDGTLVDSLADIATAINLTRGTFGLAALPAPHIIAQVGDGSDHLVRQTVPVPPERRVEALAAYLAHYERHMLDGTHLMPGVLDVLERYRDRHLAVVTNKLQHLAEKVLVGLGIRDRFAIVVGGDSLPRKKPDALPLLHVLEHCGLRPEQAVMIGDGVNDVLAAQAAGVMAVAVTFGVAGDAELRALSPDFVVHDLSAILEIID
jgi:phosphoglycolate phosphatase